MLAGLFDCELVFESWWVYCLLSDFEVCGGLCFDMCLEISFAGLVVLLWFCRLGAVWFWLLLGPLLDCFGC